MFNELVQELQKPERFKQSAKMFWQDPHIAKYLLAAHIDPKNEGASRNPDFIDQSVDFMKKFALKKGDRKIIDYGCGPGLYCERFAKEGYDITGVDFSANSIQYAKESAKDKGLAIEYRCENYLDVTDKNQYDFATLIYCDYGALAPKNRKQLLRNIWGSLRKEGRFLLDVFSSYKFDHFVEANNWYLRDQGGFWSSEAYIELAQNVKYDGYTSLEQTMVITDQQTEAYYIWHQYFTKEMILAELEEAGFTVLSIYNDVAGNAYHEGRDTIALLLEK